MHRSVMRTLVPGIVLTLVFCPAAPDRPARAPVIDSTALGSLVDSVIQAGMAKERIPGAAVLMMDHGRVVLSRGFGVADVATRRPIDPAVALWPFASITKV